MKKSFSYNLTQFGTNGGQTATEQIKTSDGVKTITTDANTGAVILADSVDEDSLNPVTGAAVATAIAQGGGGVPEYGESDAGKVLQVDAQGDELVWAVAGGDYTAGNGITISDDGEIAVALGTGGIQVDLEDNSLRIADEYGLVHVEDGSILVNHDDSLSEISDPDGHGCLTVSVPVPTVAYADTGKVLGVVDGSTASLGWVSAGGSVVTDSNAPFKGAGTAASPLGFNIDSDSLNVSTSNIGPIAYADAKFTGDSAIGTLLDTSGTVTMTFTGLSGEYGQPGDSAQLVLTYGSNNSIGSRTSGRIANDYSVTLTIDVHNADTRYGTWTADSTLYTIKIWAGGGYNYFNNVTIVDTNKRLRINRPVPAAQSADNGKVLSVTDSSGSIGWANVNVPSELPSYTSGDRGKVLSVKQTSPGSSSSTVYWATTIPGGQTLGSESASAAGSTLSVTCDTSKSALYNLVCIVPNLRVDTSLVDMNTEYYLDLTVTGGMYTDTHRISIKFYEYYGSGMAWSDYSTVMYERWNSISSVSIASLTKTDGTAVTGNWLLSGSLYVYGLA